MKKIIFILLLCFLFGCVTERQRARICRACSSDSTRINDSTVIRDSALYITQNAPSVFVPFELDSLPVLDTAAHVVYRDRFRIVYRFVKGGIMIQAGIDSLRVEILKQAVYRQVYKAIQSSTCKRDHRTGYDYFCRWAWVLFFALFVACLLIFYGMRGPEPGRY